ncbi:MAG: class I SAM-dependent methyltransferase [Acidimicrobiia bacterium]|jgi:SAM-dependent methyltransferase
MGARSWVDIVADNPDHSSWYIERFRAMAANGDDLDGEARFVDALVPRGSRILDAGCGPGRVGGALFERGHEVVGVDVDPVLIAAAEQDHPGPTWLVGDLARLDLPAEDTFDVVVCAGNVITFVPDDDRRAALGGMGRHLADDGRIAIGFGDHRGYGFDEFRADVAAAGLEIDLELAAWDVRPFRPGSDFLVALLRRAE